MHKQKSVIPAILCGKISNFTPNKYIDYCMMNDNESKDAEARPLPEEE